jgi:hypothetical protein
MDSVAPKSLAVAAGLVHRPATFLLYHVDSGGPTDPETLDLISRTVGVDGLETLRDLKRFVAWYRVADKNHRDTAAKLAQAYEQLDAIDDSADPLYDQVVCVVSLVQQRHDEDLATARRIIGNPGDARSVELVGRALMNAKLYMGDPAGDPDSDVSGSGATPRSEGSAR